MFRYYSTHRRRTIFKASTKKECMNVLLELMVKSHTFILVYYDEKKKQYGISVKVDEINKLCKID